MSERTASDAIADYNDKTRDMFRKRYQNVYLCRHDIGLLVAEIEKLKEDLEAAETRERILQDNYTRNYKERDALRSKLEKAKEIATEITRIRSYP